jgi:hypothetical protein
VREIIDSISTANSYRQRLKGRIFNFPQHSPKTLTSELRILESGYIKFYKGCFAFCVIEVVAYFEMAVSFLKKGDEEFARTLARECCQGYSVESRLDRLKKGNDKKHSKKD